MTAQTDACRFQPLLTLIVGWASLLTPHQPIEAALPTNAMPDDSARETLLIHAAAGEGQKPARPSHAPSQAFIKWATKSAVHLDTLDLHGIALEDLAILDDELKGKRIVFLGEPDHYVHEKYDFRLLLIRYLFDRGYRYLGMEQGRSDGQRIDRYLATGDKRHLSRVSSFGYKGDVRTDRIDKMPWERMHRSKAFREAALSEERWFMRQLRRFNTDKSEDEDRLHYFGYDIDLRPGGGYADVRDILDRHDQSPLLTEIRRRMALVEGESRPDEIRRLRQLSRFLHRQRTELIEQLGQADTRDLVEAIHCMKEGFTFVQTAEDGPQSPGWMKALVRREKTMYRQMDALLEALPRDAKIILMGHNYHLSKKSSSLVFGPSRRMWKSVGSHLNRNLPGEVYSIWMMYDHGRHAVAFHDPPIVDVETDPSRIEHLLAQAGTNFLLPISGDRSGANYLGELRNFCQNGRTGSGILADQLDAIFFVEKVTELRPRHEEL